MVQHACGHLLLNSLLVNHTPAHSPSLCHQTLFKKKKINQSLPTVHFSEQNGLLLTNYCTEIACTSFLHGLFTAPHSTCSPWNTLLGGPSDTVLWLWLPISLPVSSSGLTNLRQPCTCWSSQGPILSLLPVSLPLIFSPPYLSFKTRTPCQFSGTSNFKQNMPNWTHWFPTLEKCFSYVACFS
jgi:hypothetical protein